MYLAVSLYLNHSQINQLIIFGLTFLLGFLALSWTGVYLVTIGELAGDKKSGIATGLSLFFARIGLLISPPLFGYIADLNGAYQYSWLLFAFMMMGTAFFFFNN